ncbi:hypothetical protein Cfor_06517 [Coptotermes formosanus]|uniref:Glutathione S-transferase n=1 Tax=Coptotermes formosanus TaxID=36987 RepID=A0A6L2QBR0_COPFO|nr:hypothetical protein Cfor_06517 [Coptotermes formosanus]
MVARAVGVDIRVKTINLFEKEQFSSEFIKLNPQHTVPTLTDDEFVLCDSHAIASYLVRSYASDDSLYPQDPKQKAIVDQRLYFDAGILFPRLREICVPVLYHGKTEIDENQKAGLHEALSYLDIFLEGSPWVAGSNMTIADCSCVASVSTIVAYGLDISAYKNVTAWLACCQSEMPGYEEVNAPGAEALGKAVLSRLQGNKI